VAARHPPDDAAHPREGRPGRGRWRACFGGAPGVALRTGLYLAQRGRVGFVLLTLASTTTCCRQRLVGPVLARMVLSMIASPFSCCTRTDRDAARQQPTG